jgi:hypothetical protein
MSRIGLDGFEKAIHAGLGALQGESLQDEPRLRVILSGSPKVLTLMRTATRAVTTITFLFNQSV